jgi:hypothetical protein
MQYIDDILYIMIFDPTKLTDHADLSKINPRQHDVCYKQRMKAFIKRLDRQSLCDMVSIPFKSAEETNALTISMQNILYNRIEFEISYKSHPYKPCEFDVLPIELNEIIDSFLDERITLDIAIFIPLCYPFRPSNMVLTRIHCNEKIYASLQSLYCHRINSYNESLNRQWIPTITFDKQMLYIISLFSDFKHIAAEAY